MALDFLSKCISFPAGVTAQSIAEGHREKTLTLLWAIIFNFKVHIQSKHNIHVHLVFCIIHHLNVHVHIWLYMYNVQCTCTCTLILSLQFMLLLSLLDTFTSTCVHVYEPLYIARAFVCPCAHMCTSEFLMSSYDTPLAQRAFYLALHSSLFGPDGTVNYDYIITNRTNYLLIGSRCIPNGAHTNHC